MGAKSLGSLQLPPVETVDDFLYQVSLSEFLIAGRLHGVLLSHLVAPPAIAFPYDRKVRAHMQAMGQTDDCLNIDDFNPDGVLQASEALQARMSDERLMIHDKNEGFRRLLDAQYDSALLRCGLLQ